MKIQDAILEAEKINGGIVRKSVDIYKTGIVIYPSDSYATCLVVKHDESGFIEESCNAWNPTKSDLLADDWIAVKA